MIYLVQPVISSAENAIRGEIESITKLADVASSVPYYKSVSRNSTLTLANNGHRYNSMWTRDVQNVIFSILLCGWLGGMAVNGKTAEQGKLLTIEEVGAILNGRPTYYPPRDKTLALTTRLQFLLISRIETHSTSLSKNTSCHSSH